jgi:hemolysin D
MPALRLVPRPQPESAVPAKPRLQHESATAEFLARKSRLPERTTLYVLVGFIALVFTFISVVQLDRIVNAAGHLVPIAGTLTVQPLDKAIISRVLVSVGDRVKKGQVLATCDPTFAQADLLQLKQKLAGLIAHQRRVQAEADGQPFEPTDQNPYESLEASLWRQRQTEYRASVNDLDQRIAATRAQADGLRHSITDYRARAKISHEIEEMYSGLETKGYVSRLQLLTGQDQEVEMGRNLAESENTLVGTLHTLESLEEQRKVFMDKWREDVLNDLVTTNTSIDASQQDFVKSQKLADLVNLVAPEDALVISVPKLSTGGVAQDAQPLFSLVPINAPLEADVEIDSQDIGFVRLGDPVSIKLEAFKFLEHGVAEGVVKTIAQEALTESSAQDSVTGSSGSSGGTTRSPFYDARVEITALKLHDVPTDTHLIPGMVVQADIIVGKRTILWYLLGGALKSGAEAMREP